MQAKSCGFESWRDSELSDKVLSKLWPEAKPGDTPNDVLERKLCKEPVCLVNSNEEIYYLSRSGVDARMRVTRNGNGKITSYVILNGSTYRELTQSGCNEYIRDHRQQLLNDGVFAGGVTTEDIICATPSRAAAVLLGSSADGRVEWKDAEGRALREFDGRKARKQGC